MNNIEKAQPKAITEEEMAVAMKIANLCKRHSESNTRGAPSRPLLYPLLGFLSFRRRPNQNPVLRRWVRRMGYTIADVKELLHPGYELIPDNYGELKIALDLLREVNSAIEGPLNLVKMPVIQTHPWDVTDEEYGSRDSDHSSSSTPRLSDPVETHYDSNNRKKIGWVAHKCGEICECDIYKPPVKSHGEPGDGTDDDNQQDDDDDLDDNDKRKPGPSKTVSKKAAYNSNVPRLILAHGDIKVYQYYGQHHFRAGWGDSSRTDVQLCYFGGKGTMLFRSWRSEHGKDTVAGSAVNKVTHWIDSLGYKWGPKIRETGRKINNRSTKGDVRRAKQAVMKDILDLADEGKLTAQAIDVGVLITLRKVPND